MNVNEYIEHYFRTPHFLEMFMDEEVNLEYPYGRMSISEIGAVKGENKIIRILLIYVRKKIEKHSRVIVNDYHRLCFVSRQNVWVELPTWVQEVYKLEAVDPSPDFFELHARLGRYAEQYDSALQG